MHKLLQMKKPQKALPFITTRTRNTQEISEDYTRLIQELIEEKGEARTCDIAENLGVSHVTVIRTLQRLKKQGFVITKPHHPVTFTKKGKKLGIFTKKRHQILMQFLRKLGVPENIARIDAEGMEHHLSRETLDAIKQHLSLFSSQG